MLTRKKPMNPGKGFTNRGSGFKSRSPVERNQADSLALEVGEGVALPWGKGKSAVRFERDPDRVRSTPTPSNPALFRHSEPVETGLTRAMPKTVARRNSALLDMAQGRPCLLLAPYEESHDPATTVACHGNWSDMEKGGGRKADDCYVVFGCHCCHSWLDQSSAPADEKRRVFLFGMVRQRYVLHGIAASTTEPERYRKAAQWALDELQADGFDPERELQELLLI